MTDNTEPDATSDTTENLGDTATVPDSSGDTVPDATSDTDSTSEGLGDTGIAALRAERDKAKREAQARRDAEEALTEANTTLDTTRQERDEARTDLGAARTEAARYRAALAHGLTVDDLELIPTGTPDEIDARAKALAERIGATRQIDPTQGRGAAPPPTPQTPEEEFAEWVNNARKS